MFFIFLFLIFVLKQAAVMLGDLQQIALRVKTKAEKGVERVVSCGLMNNL
jgi:hypothetical protein